MNPIMTVEESLELYPPAPWAKKRVVRVRGGTVVVEDICEHEIGHPNRSWLDSMSLSVRRYEGIHGCDGCCKDGE